MLNKSVLLQQFRRDIAKMDDSNEYRKTFYIVLYNIIMRELKDDIIVYNSDYILD